MGRPKKKHPGGRPTKMTEAVVGKLRGAFKDDFTVEEACRYAGIHKDTYYEECKRNPAFADEMARAQDYPLTRAKKRMLNYIESGRNGYGALALKFLERRQRERYTPKMTVEHEGGIATYSSLRDKAAKSADEARRLADDEPDDEDD